jgi:hypothetical protein
MTRLKERVTRLSPDRRALLEDRLLQAHRQRCRPPTIARRQAGDPLVLSFGQEQMWFLDQLNPGTATYNIPDVMRVTGPLNVESLEAAFRTILLRHEVLRTRVGSVAGRPVPVLNDRFEFRIRRFELRSLLEEARDAEARRIIQEQVREPFNIAQDLTLRAALIRLRDEQYYLLILTHHIAWDVSSRVVLYRELGSIYRSALGSSPTQLQDLRIQYSDFAAWQRKQLQGEVYQGHAAYWREQLGNAAHVLDLPTDHPRKNSLTSCGGKHFFSLSPALVDQAKALSREQNATLFMTLLAAFVAFLNAFTGQNDLSVGSPMDGRNFSELENLIGFFINTTVLRFEISAETTFRKLVEQSRKVTLGAHAHSLPFEKLVEIVRPKRDPSRMALVQVNFRVNNSEAPTLELPGLQTESLPEFIDTGTAKFDLALELVPDGSHNSFIEYNSSLFEASTIMEVVREFEGVVAAVLQGPDSPLGSISALAKLGRQTRSLKEVMENPKVPDQKAKSVLMSECGSSWEDH